MLELDLLGHRRYRDGLFHRIVSPYFFAGFGFAVINPDIDYSRNTLAALEGLIERDQDAPFTKTRLSVPLGMGVRYDLSHKWSVALVGSMHTVFTDMLEGVSLSGDPTDDDWFGFAGVNIIFRVGEKDTDGDGIVDSNDNCPDVAGLEDLLGCPDSDADGVADQLDSCPLVAGVKKLYGCPDADDDGIIDSQDKCPHLAGARSTGGCQSSTRMMMALPMMKIPARKSRGREKTTAARKMMQISMGLPMMSMNARIFLASSPLPAARTPTGTAFRIPKTDARTSSA